VQARRLHYETEIPAMKRLTLFAALLLFAVPSRSDAQPKKAESEADYYKILTFTPPPGEVLEAGALEVLPDGKVAVGTRRGEIWLIDNAYDDDPQKAKFTRFAHGLHEVLGLAYKDGWLYVTHRPDITRIKYPATHGKADTFEVVTDGWEINGDYHEYAFGSRFDKKGEMWITLCLTGSFNSNSKFRGWAMRLTSEGKLVPTTSGVRSPGGVGFNADGDVFFTDNQGPWNGPCSLKQLTVGGFVGHPDSFKWYKEPEAQYLGPAPLVPKSGSRISIEAKRIPQYMPPAVQFPYAKMGQSASGIECDLSGGKFGPFEKQIFVGDQTHSTIMRVFLEKAPNGRYQGACFPFRGGFGSGIVPVRFGKDGSLFVGGTNRGWGSRGTKPWAVERLVWTGKTPFEIHEMHLKPDGFELTFTKPIDPEAAGKVESYGMKTFTYIFRAEYGSPEVDQTTPKITRVIVGPDRKSVRLYVDGLQEGHIHDLTLPGVRSAEGQPLLHPQAYYTLNYPLEK
jgi:glucose/arabinose dehydrogenase